MKLFVYFNMENHIAEKYYFGGNTNFIRFFRGHPWKTQVEKGLSVTTVRCSCSPCVCPIRKPSVLFVSYPTKVCIRRNPNRWLPVTGPHGICNPDSGVRQPEPRNSGRNSMGQIYAFPSVGIALPQFLMQR